MWELRLIEPLTCYSWPFTFNLGEILEVTVKVHKK
jgi:hypothetical protein